jgi:serine/threonine protein phosphatase PrpC
MRTSTGEVLLSSRARDFDEVSLCETEEFEVAVVSVGSPRKETSEDGVLVVELAAGGMVVCAIDGMGGMRNGREAANVALDTFTERLCALGEGTEPRAAIVEAFEMAHDRIRSRCPGGGATAACALVTTDWIQALHAGDAEALLVGEHGDVKFRTVAHSPVGYAQHVGLLEEEEALVHAERHLVSNGLGVEGMAIHIGPRIPFGYGDTLVVVSDGVTDNARESEIVESLRRGTLMRGTEELLGLCRDRMLRSLADESEEMTVGKPDDLTLVTVRRKRG